MGRPAARGSEAEARAARLGPSQLASVRPPHAAHDHGGETPSRVLGEPPQRRRMQPQQLGQMAGTGAAVSLLEHDGPVGCGGQVCTALGCDGQVGAAQLGRLGSVGAHVAALLCIPRQPQLQSLRRERIAARGAVVRLPECTPQQLRLQPLRQRRIARTDAVVSLLECDSQVPWERIAATGAVISLPE